MKKLLPLLTAALLLLTGCRNETAPEPEETLPEETTAVQTESTGTQAPTPPPETQAPTAQETVSALSPYRETLEELLAEETVLSGRFAVFDIDGDGRDELIVSYETDEGLTEYILEDSGEEFRAHAEAVFYDNGVVTAPMPDEEAGDFVPYALYQYDAERDGYYEVAFVKALEYAVLEAKGLADEYPEEADTSQSGIVCLIGNDTPVDVTEYELWRSSWMGGAAVMEIPFVELTPENATAID